MFKKENDLTPNFGSYEFQCPCRICRDLNFFPYPQDMLWVVTQLQLLRDDLNVPVIVNSAYRCPFYNKQVHGADDSPHLICMAADIYAPPFTPIEIAYKAIKYFTRVGIYIEENFCHLDLINPHPSKFWYKSKRSSILVYSKSILDLDVFLKSVK